MSSYSHHPHAIAVETHIDGTRAVVALKGELDIAGVPGLVAALTVHEAAGRDIALDLTELTYIDSSGMTVLFQIAQRARRGGWALTVVGVSRKVAEILELTGLDVVLGYAANE